MTDKLLVEIARVLLLVLDNQRHQPSLERHNQVRDSLYQAIYEADGPVHGRITS